MIFTRVVSDELSERAGKSVPRLAWRRARSLPALGMPYERKRRRVAAAISAVLHLLLVWVLLRPDPVTNMNPNLEFLEKGGGGPGPAGGGGGGTRGTGGVKYVKMTPPPQAVTPPQVAPILPPVQPVIEPPKPVVPEPVMPQLELPKLATNEPKAEVKVESPVVGTGGGTGNDGTKGNGPGTGGGVGSGIGTGRGSGVGPGTGGGNLDYYPPEPVEIPLMPFPMPAKVKGTEVRAIFDIDERGKVINFEFTPTKDGDYNRKLRDLFKTFRFRPGTTLDGKPIRAKYPFAYVF